MSRLRTLVLTVAIVAVFPVVAAAANAPSPKALLAAAIRNALARGSVHTVNTLVTAHGRVTFIADIALTRGRQIISDSTGARAEVLLLDHVAYVSGNEKGLVDYLGLSAKAARTVGRRWVSIPSASGQYAAVADDVSLPTQLASIVPSGSLKALPESAGGIGVQGSTRGTLGLAGTLTMYVTTGRRSLPDQARISISSGGSSSNDVLTLSRWGEHVTITKPAHPVPISGLVISKL